jgi:ubiquinone/menaquinone biosynthesis C-methylase UbiE
LPYLLQDIWELGSSPEDIARLVSKNIPISEESLILDLACGKGAVSIKLAAAHRCKVKGIDIFPEFISYAKTKAIEYLVDTLCKFEVGDINQSVKSEKNYDVVIFGAVGDVLGNPLTTLKKLKNTLKPDGFMVIDDGYIPESSGINYLTKKQWLKVFDKAGVQLISEKPVEKSELQSINKFNQACIKKRANELANKFPQKTRIFSDYIQSQQAECDELENEIIGVTWLLQVVSTK